MNKENTLVYLAAPYSHEDRFIKHHRAAATGIFVCNQAQKGEFYFSPVLHGHFSEMVFGHQLEHSDWIAHGLAALDACKSMAVLCVPGWEKSKGVAVEIEHAKAKGYPIKYILFDEIAPILFASTINVLKRGAE